MTDIRLEHQVDPMNRFLTLRTALENSGWSIQPIELASDCWWAKEIWELESKWRPTHRVIYLSFLLDPGMDLDMNRPPDSAVWAVGLGDFVPRSRPAGDMDVVEVPVKNKLETAIATITDIAASMRMTD